MKFVPNAVTRRVARQVLVLQKNSPHIMFAAGLVGVVGGTVLACRATLKVGDVLDEMKETVDEVKNIKTDPVGNSYPENEHGKDLAWAYLNGSYKLAKLYVPAVIVTGASVALLTGSHVTLTRRNASLTAAYTGLSKAYSEYRDRVRKELGVERELDIYHAAETEEYVDEDGKKKVGKVADPNKFSPYARFFDEGSPCWKKEPQYNKMFVQGQQNYANHLLQARGHIFLNEVYDMLGIERSPEGQIVGWSIWTDGDHYVDFGMYEARNIDFVHGRERNILLDFNVDGPIFETLKKEK